MQYSFQRCFVSNVKYCEPLQDWCRVCRLQCTVGGGVRPEMTEWNKWYIIIYHLRRSVRWESIWWMRQDARWNWTTPTAPPHSASSSKEEQCWLWTLVLPLDSILVRLVIWWYKIYHLVSILRGAWYYWELLVFCMEKKYTDDSNEAIRHNIHTFFVHSQAQVM